eukprot:3628962-Rhodomonas_salina.2
MRRGEEEREDGEGERERRRSRDEGEEGSRWGSRGVEGEGGVGGEEEERKLGARERREWTASAKKMG